MSYPARFVAGNQLTADELSDYAINPKYTYGETIAIGDQLYEATDGKAYKADADVFLHCLNYIGSAAEAGVLNDTKYVLPPGKVATGLTSITEGAPYYLSNTAGGISLTPGTFALQVGIGKSSTTMLIKPLLRINDLWTGADGALTASSGVTTWNTAGKTVYQLTSLSLTGTASLVPGSNIYGKPIFVFIDGDMTVTSSTSPAVNWSAAGAAGGTGGAGGPQDGITNRAGIIGNPGTPSAYRVLATAPGGGSPGLSARHGGGGGGGGSGIGNAGAAGSTDSSATNAGGAAGAAEAWDADVLFSYLKARPGIGGGGGGGGGGANSISGSNGSGGDGGAGGRGGGAIYFIVRGAINITSTFSVAGANGSNGANGFGSDPGGGGGGGGSGAGGNIGIFHLGPVTANSATFTVTAGTAGSGGTGSGSNGGAGGAGGAGQSIVKNLIV